MMAGGTLQQAFSQEVSVIGGKMMEVIGLGFTWLWFEVASMVDLYLGEKE